MLPQQEKNYKELSTAAEHHNISTPIWNSRSRESKDSSNPIFEIAMDSCILCGRCATACQDGAQFIGAIDVLGTGTDSRIGTFMDRPLVESVCTTCGQCLSVCPTGAIEVKDASDSPTKSVTTTCPYCGVGCQLQYNINENTILLFKFSTNKHAGLYNSTIGNY